MPQMSPMSWLFLFIMFSLALIVFAVKTYFTFEVNTITNTSQPITNINLKKSLPWKW
uniref:ATP synthase complex subunit 8 n=1 Tax=Psorodonotus venosus TaxID=494397 RepID=A0A5P8HA58_9ORTH|nr:ATP synthase F0 subunit 8 [Psorodonotus venosus]